MGAIHMQRVQATFADGSECIVLLEKELTGSIEANTMICQTLLYLFGFLYDQVHGFIPRSAFQLTVLTTFISRMRG